MRLLFWQQSQWDQLVFLHAQQRFPQALLLSGIQGLGKAQFAQHLGAWLLCHHKEDQQPCQPCQQCQSCQWMVSQSHPEWFVVNLPEKQTTISIDQIREVIAWTQLAPQYASKKWVFIEQADKLSMAASHALLKVIEEPSLSTGFILNSSFAERLQPTLLSRLMVVNFKAPLESDNVLHYNNTIPIWALRMAKGAPLLAKEFASNSFTEYRTQWIQALQDIEQQKQDPLLAAQALTKFNLNNMFNILSIFYYWLIDIVYISIHTQSERQSEQSENLLDYENNIINTDYSIYLQTLSQKAHLSEWLKLLTKLEDNMKAKSQANTNTKPDQLCFETLLIEYTNCVI